MTTIGETLQATLLLWNSHCNAHQNAQIRFDYFSQIAWFDFVNFVNSNIPVASMHLLIKAELETHGTWFVIARRSLDNLNYFVLPPDTEHGMNRDVGGSGIRLYARWLEDQFWLTAILRSTSSFLAITDLWCKLTTRFPFLKDQQLPLPQC